MQGSEAKNAKLGSELRSLNVWSDNVRGIHEGNDRSVDDQESASLLSGKQDVSKKRGTEDKQGYDGSEKTLSVSQLTERGGVVRTEHGDFKRKKILNVAGWPTEHGSFVKNELGDVGRKKTLNDAERPTEHGSFVKNKLRDVGRKNILNDTERLTVTLYGDSVMNEPDVLEHGRPTFLAIRVILSSFIKTM